LIQFPGGTEYFFDLYAGADIEDDAVFDFGARELE